MVPKGIRGLVYFSKGAGLVLQFHILDASCKSFLTDGYRGERQVLVQNVGIVDRLVEHTVDVDLQHTVLFAATGDGVP